MSGTTTLPSGLSIELRGLRGKEGQLLASREASKNGTLFHQILKGCCLSVSDEGPYQLGGQLPQWDRMLVGDTLAAMLAVRTITYDDLYPFKVQCESAACREPFEWEVRLSELPVRQLADADRTLFQGENRFPGSFSSDEKPFTYRLLIGSDTQKLIKLTAAARQDQLIASLMVRIVEIEGVHSNGKRKYLEDRPLGDLNDAVIAMDAHDCGVETDFEVECSHCGHRQEIRLPLAREFWLPGKDQMTKLNAAKEARKLMTSALSGGIPAST